MSKAFSYPTRPESAVLVWFAILGVVMPNDQVIQLYGDLVQWNIITRVHNSEASITWRCNEDN